MTNLLEALINSDLKVKAFYAYESFVTNRIFEQHYQRKTDNHDLLDAIFEKCMTLAEGLGCSRDNKITIEVEILPSPLFNPALYHGSSVFVGRKDGVVSIGLGVIQHDSYTQKYNKYFDD